MRLVKKVVDVNGLKTVYVEAGEGKEVFFFIPGWGAHPDAYSELLQLLSEKYRVISPYPPGFGKTFTPEKVWASKEYGEFFSDFLEKLSLSNVTLGGHSSSGAFALHTALQSSRVKRLVLIAPLITPIEHNLLRLITRYLYEFSIEMRAGEIRAFLQACKSTLSLIINARYLLLFSLSIFDKNIQLESSLFSRVKVPTLILWGKNDFIFGKNYALNQQKKFAHATTHFVPGMHNWIHYHPKLLVNSL